MSSLLNAWKFSHKIARAGQLLMAFCLDMPFLEMGHKKEHLNKLGIYISISTNDKRFSTNGNYFRN
jgi:hypothetical protein